MRDYRQSSEALDAIPLKPRRYPNGSPMPPEVAALYDEAEEHRKANLNKLGLQTGPQDRYGFGSLKRTRWERLKAWWQEWSRRPY